MSKTLRNAVRRSRINSEYFCSSNSEPAPEKKKEEKKTKPDKK
jgi:hypothetical protein